MSTRDESCAPPLLPSRLLFAAIVLLFAIHALWLAGIAEDAFISFRFARNWFDGHGLVWNVGEPPVEGYTNFLWVVLSTLGLWLGIDLPSWSQGLGAAAAIATLFITWQCGRLLGWSERMALLPVLALACSGPFATWAGAGMETSLFGTWIAAAVYFFARYGAGRRSDDLHFTVLFILLACLTRPEGILIAGLIGLAGMWSLRDGDAGARREFLVAGAVGAAIFALYFAWRWLYFGYPLPNTFYAKTGGGAAQAARGAQYALLFALHYVLPWAGVLGLLAFARSRASARDECTGQSATGAGRNELLLPLAGALLGLYTLYIAAVGGDYMAMYRFFVPVLPFLYLLLGAAFARAHASGFLRAGLWASLAVALLASLFHSTPLEKEVVAKRSWMHGNYRGVEKERWYVARHRLIGDLFARYGRPQESIATGAIGAVAYESGLRVYDVHGIVDPHIAHEGRSPAGAVLGQGLPGHEKSDYPYIFAKQPTFYLFNRKLFPKPFPGVPLLSPDVDAMVQRDYRIRSVWLEDEVNGEAGYFAFLERRDRPPTRPALGQAPKQAPKQAPQ
jgi:arabinofuranosyltransferase